MNLDLAGKKAFVCGSTQGIGKAVAIELASLGAELTLVARNQSLLEEVCGTLPANHGQNHSYICADFSEPEQLNQKVQSFVSNSSPVQILVNNTGGPPAGPVAEAPLEDFHKAFSSHLICNQLLAQALLPGMRSEKYGRIINIISTSVKAPLKGLGVSNTIRGAVANWAKTLAGEVAQFGVTVNNVLPGATKTQRLQKIIDSRSEKTDRPADEVRSGMINEIPARRFGEPEELAYAVAFLASPAAAYITGINLPVDGGRTASL